MDGWTDGWIDNKRTGWFLKLISSNNEQEILEWEERWCVTKLCVWKMVWWKMVCVVKDGVWQNCMWKMACQGWCVTKWCVKDGVRKKWNERWCVIKWCVKDGMWQNCVW